MEKINHFDRDPKLAVIKEIEMIIDNEKRYDFEELKDRFLT